MSKLLLAAAVLLVPSLAWPCSPPPPMCTPGRTAPARGESLPANAPGVAVISATVSGGVPEPELVDAQDRRLRTRLGTQGQLHLDEPLREGETYRVRAQLDCEGDPRTVPFGAAAPAPLPTTTGTLTSRRLANGQTNVATSRGSCNTPALVAAVRLGLNPSAELVPFLPIARFETLVDGEVWASQPFATPPFPSSPAGELPPITFPAVDVLYARCDERVSGDANGLEQGRHRVEVRAWLAGLDAPLASAELDVELRCEELRTQRCDPEAELPQPLCGGLQMGCGCANAAGGSPLLGILPLLWTLRRRRAIPR